MTNLVHGTASITLSDPASSHNENFTSSQTLGNQKESTTIEKSFQYDSDDHLNQSSIPENLEHITESAIQMSKEAFAADQREEDEVLPQMDESPPSQGSRTGFLNDIKNLQVLKSIFDSL